MKDITRVWINTWGNYNNGGLGFGWMTPSEALEFIEEHEELEEFFIADIDNYTGFGFGDIEYRNVTDICEEIKALEELEEWERDEVETVAEYRSCSVFEAIENRDYYTIYASIDDFYDIMDELIECEIRDSKNSILTRYFDYDQYHSDCLLDVYEASNGCIVLR